jgi:hypothetical protein
VLMAVLFFLPYQQDSTTYYFNIIILVQVAYQSDKSDNYYLQ